MKLSRQIGLAVAPYVLLLGFVLISGASAGFDPTTSSLLVSSLRWLLALLYLAGAYLGWRLYEQADRPSWWYPWLGFATYELVALLLLAVNWLLSQLTTISNSWGWLYLVLLPLAFLPYFGVALWMATHNQQVALFTLFPQAALTLPLFLLIGRGFFGNSLESEILWSALAPTLVAGLVTGLWLTWPVPQRTFLLYAGVILSQLALAVGLTWQDSSRLLALLLTLPLSMLGLLILVGPLVLLPLLNFVLRRITADEGATVRQQVHNWLHRGRNRLAPSAAFSQPADNFSEQDAKGVLTMSELEAVPPAEQPATRPARPPAPPAPPTRGDKVLERLFKTAVVLLTGLAVLGIVLFVARASVYKIHEYERGLHLRGGRFISVQNPGWHFQIPLVDTVIIVKVNERLGYVERIPAMASDNVTMIVSLQYTYRVTDPQQFALQVDDPERIVFEFVQGKLRDVINTKAMADVMNNRVLMNDEVMTALKEKEAQYGVQFITVQMQSASPPDEVLAAIKDRMVAGQRQEQAEAEAEQKKTQADADLYAAQKVADAQAYQITKTAEAEAQRIRLTTEAQQLSIRAMLSELDGKGALAEQYLQYLTAQALQTNSKWVIGGGTPLLDLRGNSQPVPPADNQ